MICTKNTNNYCYVTLTEFGNSVLDRERNICKQNDIPYIEPLRTDLGIRFQIWELMQIFGPAMYNGSIAVPFVNNEIKFET